MARGIRNNNPGNIRISEIPWLGKVVPNTDGVFEQFDTAIHGIRALCLNLLSYYRDYDLNTVAGIISRWAPASENNTPEYESLVCSRMGVTPDQVLDVESVSILTQLASAIIWQENGEQPYSTEILTQAAQAVLLAM